MEHPVGTSLKMDFGGVLRKLPNGRWTYDYYIGGSIRKKASTWEKDVVAATEAAREIASTHSISEPSFGKAYESDYYDVYKTARSNAKKKCREFALTLDEYAQIVSRSEGVCEVTGIRFQRVRNIGKRERQPFMPSLDRIDSSEGYTLDNCRLVCTCVNYVMNTWGDWVLAEVVIASVKRLPKWSKSKLRWQGAQPASN